MRRAMSLLLVLAMVLSVLPVAAFAADPIELLKVENESVTEAGYTYTYTADSAGTLNVSVGTCSPGWRYKIIGPDGIETTYRNKYGAGESCDYTGQAGSWTVKFFAYSSSRLENVAGKVSFTLRFTPSGSSGVEDILKTEYAISDTKLALGDNMLTALETANTSIYAFKPTQTGVYTFTAPAGAVVGYWGGGTWLLTDPKATSNILEWTCTAVGQSAYIGVSGVENGFTLNLAKTGDYSVAETPIVKYKNKATLEAFTVPAGAKLGSYVDVYSQTAHTAVYSKADGYYHLDSVDGDVLLIDFDYMDIILSAALESDRPVMYAYTTDENGNDVKYDIGAAVLAYEAVMDGNGYYPVTEDILLFYKVYAMGAGTFTFRLTGDYNEACVWMYCMRTMNMDDVARPAEPACVASVYADGKPLASYESLAEAVAACAKGQYVSLVADVTEDITVSSDLYLDLAGFHVNGIVTVAEGATLYGMDSATNDYDCADGYGTITEVRGNVASNHRTDVAGTFMRYLAVSENGTVSFHRFYVGITTMSVVPATASVGYKAEFWGDSVVKAQLDATDAFGFRLWLNEDDVVTAGAGAEAFVSGKKVSLRLQNFDVINYGEENVYGQVYLKLSDGTVITGPTHSYTLRSLVETVAADLTPFNSSQLAALKTMCHKYAVMADWNIASILNWTAAA